MPLPEVAKDPTDAVLVGATNNWAHVRWRGHHLWQNLLDLNVISEHVLSYRPEVIVETGTWQGGSAIFFADMMQLSGCGPDVLSIDLAPQATPPYLGVRYLTGRSSTDAGVAAEVAAHVGSRRAFVVLDSDHGAEHVYRELLCYAPLIAVGGHLLVEDGSMHTTFAMPLELTPLGGIARFLADDAHYEIDKTKSPFATTGHVYGWLRRVR